MEEIPSIFLTVYLPRTRTVFKQSPTALYEAEKKGYTKHIANKFPSFFTVELHIHEQM